MFWRNGLGQNPGRWHGPATVINHENNSIVWLSHIGRIYRTAPEHIRSLSIREHQEFQEQKTQSNASIPSQIGKGVFQYEDLTQQTSEPSELTMPDPDSMINPQVLENPNQPTVENMEEHQPNSGVPAINRILNRQKYQVVDTHPLIHQVKFRIPIQPLMPVPFRSQVMMMNCSLMTIG